MKLQVFSVFDKAVNAFLPPFFARAKGEAVRNFSTACNDKEHLFNRHSVDYVLMFLGEWDDVSGVFEGSQPVRILNATEVMLDDVFKAEDAVDAPPRSLAKRLPM